MHKLFFIFILLISNFFYAQDLNCNLVVEARQTGNENLQVFKTLERQLSEFINNTKWTTKETAPKARIDCSMVINIVQYNNSSFSATIQVQSARPVFGSTYTTPVYNFKDNDFAFEYTEFQNLNYNANQYVSNLISVLAFHVYIILGIDADTYAPNGGDDYFRQAQRIVNYSQQENYKGWELRDGNQNRYVLIDNILSPTFKGFRNVVYNYHRHGLDVMSDDVKAGKAKIATTLVSLNEIAQQRPNSFLMRVFFDTKADEISNIFSDGPSVEITDLVSTLNRVAPTYSSKWRNIKF